MEKKIKITGQYSQKPYQCSGCGKEETRGTNHWGDIYPYCQSCRSVTVWNCLEAIPDGYVKPKPWKIVKLGDIVSIN